MLRSTALICGVPLDDVTLREAVHWVDDFVQRGRATGRAHQVATVNVDFLVSALKRPDLLALLQRADLAVPDGMPVVWASRWLGSPLRERVAGADLVPALAAHARATGYSMYLLGGAPGVADHAARILRARHPGLEVVSDDGGKFFDAPESMDPRVIDRIRAHRPDVLCVAFGHPKQELWINRYRQILPVPVMIGVGGTLDFLTGTQLRAPHWMQRTGTEWLHRSIQEPRRLLPRYARDLVRIGPRLVWEVMLLRTSEAADARPAIVESNEDTTVLRPRGRLELHASSLGWTEDQWRHPGPGQHLVIDFAERSMLSRSEVAAIAGLAKRLFQGGGQITLVSVPATLAKQLLQLRVYGFVPTASASALVNTAAGADLYLRPPALSPSSPMSEPPSLRQESSYTGETSQTGEKREISV